MKDIVILGSGGFAKEVAFLIEDINRHEPRWKILGYIESDVSKIGKINGKFRIINTDDWLVKVNKPINVAIGIGNPKIIKKLSESFKENKNLCFPNLIHPSAVGDWDRIQFGYGNIICSGNTFTTDIRIGSFNIFNLNCTLGHDSKIGDYNIINPTVNLSGGVIIGDCCLIGTGAEVLQYIKIESNSVIGAGAVVTKDINEPGIYVGIPARKMNE